MIIPQFALALKSYQIERLENKSRGYVWGKRNSLWVILPCVWLTVGSWWCGAQGRRIACKKGLHEEGVWLRFCISFKTLSLELVTTSAWWHNCIARGCVNKGLCIFLICSIHFSSDFVILEFWKAWLPKLNLLMLSIALLLHTIAKYGILLLSDHWVQGYRLVVNGKGATTVSFFATAVRL